MSELSNLWEESPGFFSGIKLLIDKPEAKSQSKAQSPKKPQKRKEEFVQVDSKRENMG